MVAMGVAEGRNPGKQRANSSYTANWPGETPAVWRGGSGSQHCCIVTTHLQATKSPSPSLLALSTHLGPELLRQSLGLVLHHGWVEVPPALTAGLFARLKLLRRGSVCSHSTHIVSSHPHTLTSQSRLSISEMAFSTAIFCMKAQASSVLSALSCWLACSIITFCSSELG